MMPTNWLGAGPLIATRVDTAAPELTRVQIVSGLGEAMEINTESPAAYVHWAGDSLSDHAGRGIAARAVQKWMVTIAVAAPGDVGPILSKLITALSGAELSDTYEPMMRVPADRPVYHQGFGFYTLAFDVALFA